MTTPTPIGKAVPSALNPATASWQSADAFTSAQGGAGQVATPRWPGALPGAEHAEGSDDASNAPEGTVPSPYATAAPWLGDYGDAGTAVPVQPQGTGLAGAAAPNGVASHNGYGGTSQALADHGQDDGSSAYLGRNARGAVSIPKMRNLVNRLMPTDWKKVYGPDGQYTSYTFNRPSLQITQLSATDDNNAHEVGYEAGPIYANLAQVAQQQAQVNSALAPDGGMPDLTPYQDNNGNPLYDAPPDPSVTTTTAPASSAGYSFGDLYGG